MNYFKDYSPRIRDFKPIDGIKMGSTDYHINLIEEPTYHAPERHDGRNSSKAAYIREKLGSKGTR